MALGWVPQPSRIGTEELEATAEPLVLSQRRNPGTHLGWMAEVTRTCPELPTQVIRIYGKVTLKPAVIRLLCGHQSPWQARLSSAVVATLHAGGLGRPALSARAACFVLKPWSAAVFLLARRGALPEASACLHTCSYDLSSDCCLVTSS